MIHAKMFWIKQTTVHTFLSKLNIPVLSDEDREDLEKKNSKEKTAVSALAVGKHQGKMFFQ